MRTTNETFAGALLSQIAKTVSDNALCDACLEKQLGSANTALNTEEVARTLSQFYTRTAVAKDLVDLLFKQFDPTSIQYIEPSAGTGAFSVQLPPGSHAYDIDPKAAGIIAADFLKTELPDADRLAIVGNPPFGKNASQAVRFFNHAASKADIIAFVLPRSFRKMSIQNRLDRNFHLWGEKELPYNSFVFCGRVQHIPTIFQVWVRQEKLRELHDLSRCHQDFEFVKDPSKADFAMRRAGARAGQLISASKANSNTHYFISAKIKVSNVESVMKRIDFSILAYLTSATRSLSKPELIALYAKAKSMKPGFAKRVNKVSRESRRDVDGDFDRFKDFDPSAFERCRCARSLVPNISLPD